MFDETPVVGREHAIIMLRSHLLAFSLFLIAVDAIHNSSLCDSSIADFEKRNMCTI